VSAVRAEGLPPEAAAVALTGLSTMTPARLRLLLRRHEPSTALAVACGEAVDPVFTEFLAVHGRGDSRPGDWFARWQDELRRDSVGARYERFLRSGIGVVLHGAPGYPPCLLDDPEAPMVLYYRGSLDVLDGRRLAIVGTRSATATGLRLAGNLGRTLAEQGVRVVSGLARGIDGAAHRGALAATAGGPPIAVVASGLDTVYPREHTALWDEVACCGLLLGERPPGAAPLAHSFPERNRVLAALSEVVVVVESRTTGGSLITAREAMKRDISVMAVPGSVSSRASEGTNALLRDGVASVLLDPTDALVALGLDTRRASTRRYDPRPQPDAAGRHVLELIGGDAVTLDELVLRSGRALVEVAVTLGQLEAAGHVARSGGWFVAS
jgi:DNA processing protein